MFKNTHTHSSSSILIGLSFSVNCNLIICNQHSRFFVFHLQTKHKDLPKYLQLLECFYCFSLAFNFLHNFFTLNPHFLGVLFEHHFLLHIFFGWRTRHFCLTCPTRSSEVMTNASISSKWSSSFFDTLLYTCSLFHKKLFKAVHF